MSLHMEFFFLKASLIITVMIDVVSTLQHQSVHLGLSPDDWETLGMFKCHHVQGKKIQFKTDDCCQFQIPCLFVFQQQFISLLLLSVTVALTQQLKTISYNFWITLKIRIFSASSQDLSSVISRIYCIFPEFHTVINRLKDR